MEVVTLYCKPQYAKALFLASVTGLNERMGVKLNIDPTDEIKEPVVLSGYYHTMDLRYLSREVSRIISEVDRALENPSQETISLVEA